MSAESLVDAKKSYLTSLKAKLKAAYRAEAESDSTPDRRWLNGFMAAGFHSGMIDLTQLRLEHLSAYRQVYGERMGNDQAQKLAKRLVRLCEL